MCYKREKSILKLFGNLVKQEHFSTVMKQATDCDWGLGGLNPLLKIPAGLSPKNPLFQMPSFGFHSPFPWEPPEIQLSLRGVAPDLQTAWCAVFAFQANSQGSLRKRCQGQTKVRTSGLVRVSPGTGDGQVHAEALVGGEGEVPWGSKVSSATSLWIPLCSTENSSMWCVLIEGNTWTRSLRLLM